MRISNGSTIKVIPAVSPTVLLGVAGSGAAFDLSGYYGAMVIGSTGSNGGGTGVTFKVVRSATSNGTFNFFGMTVGPITTASGATSVRNFLVNTSCVWHKVVYNNNAGGSYTPVCFVLAMKGPYEPVLTQNASPAVTVQADVLVG